MPLKHHFSRTIIKESIVPLTALHSMLEDEGPTTRDDFLDLMNAAFEHGKLDPRKLSDDLGYSVSAVYRWIEGVSAPHKSLWPKVSEWILQAIADKIDRYESLYENTEVDRELIP